MSIHRFISRHFSIEVNFKNLLEVLRHHNQKSLSADKVKFSAVIMKALALTYAFRASDGTQPYRRLSGYPPMFAWQKSFQSKTIDISLMLVREFDNEKQQTLNYRFKSVDQQTVAQLSQRLIEIQTQPEDEVDQFRQLKKIAKLPRFFALLPFPANQNAHYSCPIYSAYLAINSQPVRWPILWRTHQHVYIG